MDYIVNVISTDARNPEGDVCWEVSKPGETDGWLIPVWTMKAVPMIANGQCLVDSSTGEPLAYISTHDA